MSGWSTKIGKPWATHSPVVEEIRQKFLARKERKSAARRERLAESTRRNAPDVDWNIFLEQQSSLLPRLQALLERSRTVPVEDLESEVVVLLEIANVQCPEWPGQTMESDEDRFCFSTPEGDYLREWTAPPEDYLRALPSAIRQAYEDWKARRASIDYVAKGVTGDDCEMGDPVPPLAPGYLSVDAVRAGLCHACAKLPLQPLQKLLRVDPVYFECYVERWHDQPEDWYDYEHPITVLHGEGWAAQ